MYFVQLRIAPQNPKTPSRLNSNFKKQWPSFLEQLL